MKKVWQYQYKGGVNDKKWFTVSDWVYEYYYKDSIYNTRQIEINS